MGQTWHGTGVRTQQGGCNHKHITTRHATHRLRQEVLPTILSTLPPASGSFVLGDGTKKRVVVTLGVTRECTSTLVHFTLFVHRHHIWIAKTVVGGGACSKRFSTAFPPHQAHTHSCSPACTHTHVWDPNTYTYLSEATMMSTGSKHRNKQPQMSALPNCGSIGKNAK